MSVHYGAYFFPLKFQFFHQNFFSLVLKILFFTYPKRTNTSGTIFFSKEKHLQKFKTAELLFRTFIFKNETIVRYGRV